MMGLAYVLSKLPARPDMPAELLHSYPIGIERLRGRGGDAAVQSLYEVGRDLEFRPTSDEVVELGKAIICVNGELMALRKDRVRRRCATHHERRRPDRPTPRYGFRRGPRAGG
jgi:hypothetical protein